MKTVFELIGNKKTVAIVCNQWGDTGKGKFVDYFAEWADIIARGTGGANAGHTICHSGKTIAFHLVPSGITYEGKINILGNGVAFDPKLFLEELEVLEREGISYNNLFISHKAHLVLPQHLLLDRLKESSSGRIGTTGRGIGPVYEDVPGRVGLTVNDLLNPEIFKTKFKENLTIKLKMLSTYDPEIIKNIMEHQHLGNGIFYDSKDIININAVVETYLEYGKKLKKLIKNTDEILRQSVGNKKILLEGAQGHMLSVSFGPHPYVTSSDCSIPGLARGVGLSEKDIDLVYGIVKAPYITRVGEGPFPTELGGIKSSEWCSSHKRLDEEEKYPNADKNSKDEFEQGIAIRRLGNEYGATTGRPRRTGWLDLPLLRSAIKINGNKIILTKPDVLTGCEKIKICDTYIYQGPNYQVGNKTLLNGTIIKETISDNFILQHCTPVYIEFPGWQESIKDVKNYEDLPHNLKIIIDFIEFRTGVNIEIVSLGPERNQTIIR